MARMQGNTISYSNYFFIDWDLNGQNEDGNYSAISWRAYWHFQGSDRQLDDGDASVDGLVWDNGGRLYNFASNYTTRDLLLANSSKNIGHDGNGNRTFNVNGSVLGYQGERSSGSQNFGLPGLYQAIAYNYINIVNVTDVGFQVEVQSNRVANLLQYNLDGAGWVTHIGSNWQTTTSQIGGVGSPISSGFTHTLQVRIRRASNNWVTDSGVYYIATAPQGKFFDVEL